MRNKNPATEILLINSTMVDIHRQCRCESLTCYVPRASAGLSRRGNIDDGSTRACLPLRRYLHKENVNFVFCKTEQMIGTTTNKKCVLIFRAKRFHIFKKKCSHFHRTKGGSAAYLHHARIGFHLSFSGTRHGRWVVSIE